MNRKVKDKVFTAVFIVIAIALLLGVIFWFRWQMDSEINTSSNNYLSKNVNALAAVFQTKMEDQLVMLESQARYFSDVDLTNYNEMKETILSTRGIGAFQSIGVASSAGSTMNYRGKSSGNILLQDYFRQAMEGENAISAKTITDEHGNEVLVLAVPIFQEDAVVGVIYGTFTSSEISKLLNVVQFDESGANVLITEDGTVLAHTANAELVGEEFENIKELIPEAKLNPDAQNQFYSYTLNGRQNLLVLTPVGVHDWYFGSILPETVLTDQVARFSGYVLIAVFSIAAVFTALLLFILFSSRRNEKVRKELDEKASRDSITGLLNKLAFQVAVQQSLESDKENTFLLCMIDLDNFKHVNDTYGHAAGDMVIVETANRLKHIFREQDLIGRVGGDEYSVFMRCQTSDKAEMNAMIGHRAEDILRSLNAPYVFGKDQFTLSASVGFAAFPEHGRDYQTLYENADKALYSAKTRGKNCYEIYS